MQHEFYTYSISKYHKYLRCFRFVKHTALKRKQKKALRSESQSLLLAFHDQRLKFHPVLPQGIQTYIKSPNFYTLSYLANTCMNCSQYMKFVEKSQPRLSFSRRLCDKMICGNHFLLHSQLKNSSYTKIGKFVIGGKWAVVKSGIHMKHHCLMLSVNIWSMFDK